MKKKESLLSQLFVFAGNYKYLTLLGMLLSAISSIMSIIPIIYIWLCTKEMIITWPNITMNQNIKDYAWLAFFYAIFSIIVYFLSLMCTHIAAFRIAKNMRYQTLNHLMKLPLGYFTEEGSGKLKRIVDESSGQTESYLAHQLPDLVGATITPIVSLALLFVFNWKIGILTIMPIFIGFIFMFQMIGPDHKENLKKYQTSLENMNNEAVEYIRGIPIVKAFSQSVFSFKRFHSAILNYKEYVVEYTLMFRRPMCSYTVFINSIGIFLAIGGSILITKASNPMDLFTDFLFYLFFTPMCLSMMNKIMWTSQETMIATDALNRIKSILNEKILEQKSTGHELDKFDISFEDVSFRYSNSENNALSNVNLDISQGSTIALVGESGGGKSTVASLVARFYDVSDGSIKIGGIDIRDLSEKVLMDNISFVFQNSKLFKTSILENVKESKSDATEEEVLNALKMARCEDIIRKFPDGINTIIGSKGVYLSGGETQRLALARAILKDAPIILLDEATAFADPENEYEIQMAFSELTRGKTVLIIAHRLSTIKNVDNIYVLKEGRIIESGKHNDLLGLDKVYCSMWKEYEKAATWKLKEDIVNG